MNTELTEELKKEGEIREIIRQIQVLRKQEGLKPGDYTVSVTGVPLTLAQKGQIIKETCSESVEIKKLDEVDTAKFVKKEIKLYGRDNYVAIKKLIHPVK